MLEVVVFLCGDRDGDPVVSESAVCSGASLLSLLLVQLVCACSKVPPEKARQVMKIIHSYRHVTSIFDDFGHYEKRQEEGNKRAGTGSSVSFKSCQSFSVLTFSAFSCLTLCLAIVPGCEGILWVN